MFEWEIVYCHRNWRKHGVKKIIIVWATTLNAAKEQAQKQLTVFANYQYESGHRTDLSNFLPDTEKETKTCLQCGQLMPIRRNTCTKCGYRFPTSCQGCGRETTGRAWCKECGDHGIYHFQRVESLRLTRPEEKNVENFANSLLLGRKDEDFGC